MPDPFRAAVGVLGSFADWVGNKNGEWLMYQRYGPAWKDTLRQQAREEQLKIDEARTKLLIKQEDLTQERLETAEGRARLQAKMDLGRMPAEDRYNLSSSGSIPSETKLDDRPELVKDPHGLAPKLKDFYMDQYRREAAGDFEKIDAIKSLRLMRQMAALENQAQAGQIRALTPEKVRSERGLAEQRETSADVNRAREAKLEAEAPLSEEEFRESIRKKRAEADLTERELQSEMTPEEIRDSRFNPRRGEDILTRARRIGSRLSAEERQRAEGAGIAPKPSEPESSSVSREELQRMESLLEKHQKGGKLTDEEIEFLRTLRERGVI